MEKTKTLDDADFGRNFIMCGFFAFDPDDDKKESGVLSRMIELGFMEGAVIKKLHSAPFSHDPIAVEVDGHLVALRRAEAKLVKITVDQRGSSA